MDGLECAPLVYHSRRQLAYRITHGTTELIQVLSVHPTVKRSTNISAFQPEPNVVQLIDHRVLDRREPETACGGGGGYTLIIVRRELTEPKTALAGAMLATSFARFMASMATFIVEMVPSCPLGSWGVAAIVEAQRCGEKTVLLEGVRKSPSPDGDRRPLSHGGSRANGGVQ